MQDTSGKGRVLGSVLFSVLIFVLMLMGLSAYPDVGLARPLGGDVSGDLSANTTWTLANSPYVLTGDVVVPPTYTLTIEPGVVVKGNSGKELIVRGHLAAVGTASQPITFTSSADNGPAQWTGLVFDGGTGNLEYVTVRYGGDWYNSILDGIGESSDFVYGSNIAVRDVLTGQVRLASSWVMSETSRSSNSDYKDFGLYVENSRVVVTDTVIRGNGWNSNDYALYVTGASSVLTATGNTIEGNAGWAMRMAPGHLRQTGLSGNIFQANGYNRILIVGGTIQQEVTLPPQAGLKGYQLDGDFTIPPTYTLTVQPGVVVKGNSGKELIVRGHLAAVGTASQPITFTSSTDSGPAQWTGLVFDGGTGNLEYVTVRYGGDWYNSILDGIGESSDFVYGSNIAVRDVLTGQVRLASSWVMSETSRSSNSDYKDFGLYVENSRVVVTDTVIRGNGWDSNDYALYVTGASSVLTATGNTIESNAGWAMRMAPGHLRQTGLSGNTFQANGYNRILIVGGGIQQEVTLPPQAGLKGYQLNGDFTIPPTYTLTVQPGVVVRGNSGKELIVRGHLEVVGTATDPITFTSSTDSGPAQWTGLVFDGGTGNLEYVTVRYAGDWYNSILDGIGESNDFVYGSNIAVRDVLTGQVRLASSWVMSETSRSSNSDYKDFGLYVKNSRVVVTDTVIRGNGRDSNDYALYVTGASVVMVNNSAIAGNAGKGLYSDGTIEVDARSNWWGDASGPSGDGPGTGQSVAGNVVVFPWLPVSDLSYKATAEVYDAGDFVTWDSLSWTSTDVLTVAVRVGNTPDPDAPEDIHWTAWLTTASSPLDLSALPISRYVQWHTVSSSWAEPGVTVTSMPFAYTIAGSNLSSDVTWAAADSPYLVKNNVLVQEGATLTIEPGVTVWVSDTRKFMIDGALIARGTATQPITVTSWHVQGQPGDWQMIQFRDTSADAVFDAGGNYVSGSVLQYATVEYAGYTGAKGAIETLWDDVASSSASPFVDHCTVRYSAADGVYNDRGAGMRIQDSVITENGHGIQSSGSSSVIVHNVVTQNDYEGIKNSGASSIISSNDIISNGETGIENSGNAVSIGDNTAIQSGEHGIVNRGSGVFISGNEVRNNGRTGLSNSYGGSSVSIKNNVISENPRGIYNDDAHVVISSNVITGNAGYSNGGGIYNDNSGDYVTISDNLIRGNGVSGDGGGIWNHNYVDNVTIQDNTIVSNTAANRGGGLFNEGGSVTLNRNTLSDNAAYDAAGIYWDGSGSITQNSITNNTITATQHTGGIYVAAGYPVVNHNDLHGNPGYVLYNNNGASSSDLDARYNWWGTTDHATVDNVIFDSLDDANKSLVIYAPVLPSGYADLSASAKLVAPSVAALNLPVTYTIALTNPTPVAVNPLVITDTLSPSLTYRASGGTDGLVYDAGQHQVTWQGILGPYAERELQFSVMLDPGVSYGTRITNTALVGGKGLSETLSLSATLMASGIGVTDVAVAGPTRGLRDTLYAFTATVTPTDAMQPITYTWQVVDRLYDTDLESDSGGLVSSGGSWAWGVPSSGPNGAHSGSRVWATNLSGNYSNNENSYLTSPEIDLSGLSRAALALEWWHWYSGENSDDYISVEVSKDGGATWQILYGEYHGGNATEELWVQRSRTLDPTYAVSNFRFRFRFRSDGSVNYPGWYLDDIVLRTTGLEVLSPIQHIGGVSDTVRFMWAMPGKQVLQVIAQNSASSLMERHSIDIQAPLGSVVIAGPTVVRPDVASTFEAAAAPLTATTPVTYTWRATGQAEQTLVTDHRAEISYMWTTLGQKTITVTASNVLTTVNATYAVTVKSPTVVDKTSISQDTTWTAADSPYLLTKNLSVDAGATLTLEPGVTVWFSSTALVVNGELVARGTPEQYIYFTSWRGQPQAGDWEYIVFGQDAVDATFDGDGNYLGGSALQYVIVEYAGAGVADYAVQAPDTALYLDHCVMRYNGVSGVRVGGGVTYLTFNEIYANTGHGLYATGGTKVLSHNTVRDHVDYGVTVDGGDNVLRHNTVYVNGSHGLNANGGGNAVYGNHVYSNGGYGINASGGQNTVYDNAVQSNGGYGIEVRDGANTVYENEVSHSAGRGILAGGNYNLIHYNLVQANRGGGIASSGDFAKIENNTLVGNTTSQDGGGFYSDGSRGVFQGNIVRENTGTRGGGLYASGLITVSNNLFERNTATQDVAGLWVTGSGGDLTYNSVVSNTCVYTTGGIYVGNGYPLVRHNAIYGNSGRALYNANPRGGGADRLDARYNWWGTDVIGFIDDQIYDFGEDSAKSIVYYVPYLFDAPNLKPAGINLSGRTAGLVGTQYEFNASVYPMAAITPITYTWQATGQAPVYHTVDSLYDTAHFTWQSEGQKIITVIAENAQGATEAFTYTIALVTASSSDAYEADDLCAQAQALTSDGTTQFHTFHAADDTDWTVFTATAGATYVIEATTPDDSKADVQLEVYDTCDSSPRDDEDKAFGPDVSLTFNAPADGPIYLRLRNQASASRTASRAPSSDAQAAAYYLTARELGTQPQPGVVVIVAGKRKDNDAVQPNIYHVTNQAYRLFIENGYTGEDIWYLAPTKDLDGNGVDDDLDGDGLADVDDVSSAANLEAAITTWAVDKLQSKESKAFTLYLMDHGDIDLFYLNRTGSTPETLTPHNLDAWLETLETQVPEVKVNVIFDACHSGSFINEAPQTISKPGRVVIASTGAWPLAYASDDGAVFSDAFIAALGRGMSLYSGFTEAKWAIQQGYPAQTPWIDDNGNGIPNETEDGQVAARRGFAYAGTFDSINWPPYIVWATADEESGRIAVQVEAEEGVAVAQVWAMIYPPSYEATTSGEDMIQVDVPTVTLTAGSAGLYTVQYNDFTETGDYRVVVYAEDERGLSARPREATAPGAETVNLPPREPAQPVPADQASNVPLTQTLRWRGGDPDGQAVTYTVAFGTSDTPPVVARGVTTSSYAPGALVVATTYYWRVTATDGVSTTVGPLWQFTTASGDGPGNQAPFVPANPVPTDQASNVPLTQTLQWQGGDPDGQAVTYTVALGTSDSPPVVATAVTMARYDPGVLMTGTLYYWRVTATDGVSTTTGPLWQFTTASDGGNRAPFTPHTPEPADGATNVAINALLNWKGGDPDGGPVIYTVALGVGDALSIVAQTAVPGYEPSSPLQLNTRYTWRITATDGISVSAGGRWSFTTTNRIPTTTAQTTLDPISGGSLVFESAQGVTMTLQAPGGAVTDVTHLSCLPVETVVAPEGFGFAGHAFDLYALRDLMPLPGFVFERPVTITLRYTDDDVLGLDEDTLTLRRWENGVGWVSAGITWVRHDKTANVIVFTIDHLSKFALFGELINALPYTPHTPMPVDGSQEVPLDQVFSWQGGDPDGDLVIYTVVISNLSMLTLPPIVSPELTTTTFTPTSMTPHTHYQWRVTATDGTYIVPGPLWTFTTAAASDSFVYLPLVLRN